MKIEIQSRNYFIKDNLRGLIEKKVEKLSKYFNDTASAKVICAGENNGMLKLELTIVDKGLIFKSERVSDNMYENLDIVLPKVEKQIVKTFEKIKDRLKANVDHFALEFISDLKPEAKAPRVVKEKKIELVPLTREDAITNMQMLGHDFYMYLSKETGNVHLIYTRNDGDLGEIEGVNDWKI